MTGVVPVGQKHLELADWRRRTAGMYAAIREASDIQLAWRAFIAARDGMFTIHPQSPLGSEQIATFGGLSYYPYDPAFRIAGRLDFSVAANSVAIDLPHDGPFRMTRMAAVHFTAGGQANRLSLFWIEGYGGGLFLPFRDRTNQTATYGGGRYLYDTIKGADLGTGRQEILLDFNFAYNPSCAYSVQWVCPLPPAENTLEISITAGEKRFESPA